MSAQSDERQNLLTETQRIWLKQLYDLLQVRVADGPTQSGALPTRPDSALDGADADPKRGSLPPRPLYQSQTLPQQTAPGQPQAQPKPRSAPKARFVVPVPRFDNFPIAKATEKDELEKLIIAQGGAKAKDLGKIRAIAREAANMGVGPREARMLDGKVPDEDETNQIRESGAKLNKAVMYGQVEDAARISRELGLPIRDDDISRHLAEEKDGGTSAQLDSKKWKTLVALGVVKLSATRSGNSITASNPNVDKQGLKRLNALNGTASFAQLVDDMSALGVSPLSGVPEQDQIESYMQKVRKKAEDDFKDKPNKQKLVADALLQASQRLMDGMLVHYRGASEKNVDYGPTTMRVIYLYKGGQVMTEDGKKDGKRITLELPSIAKDDPQKAQKEAAQKAEIRDWVKKKGGDNWWVTAPRTPEGWGDMTRQEVYGSRYQSDCEGMASFRLRTLPSDFKQLGVVTGFLQGDRSDGHLVAVYQSPDGRVFLSSNGKQPIEVQAQDKNKPVTESDIRSAVVNEFDAIYGGGKSESSFTFGVGKWSPPDDRSTGAVNRSTDRVLREATADEEMRTFLKKDPKLKMTPPPVDWGLLAPATK
jgi:hypothetical protein